MKRRYIVILILLSVFTSCTKNFEDFNTDKKNPAEVPGEALFSNAQKDLSDQVNQANINWNIWRLMAQYWTETTYTDEVNYDLVTRNIPQQIFRANYRRVLTDLKKAKELITNAESTDAAAKNNKLQIIELLNVYTYQRLVDIFGMVPYSEALDIGNVYPKYDDGYEIYKDLFSRLDAALSALDASAGSFGSADLYYGGDVASWIKFGNSLKIKMGITIADADNALAKSAVEAGVKNCFASASDNCELAYLTSSPNQNPIYSELVATGRHDFVAANTMTDIMNNLQDPRLAAYYTQTDTSTNSSVVKLAYLGGTYGYSAPYAQYSHVADAVLAPDFPGLMMTYSEIQFYLAEAAERGYNVPKTAEEYYDQGIKASFAFWGVSGVDDYLAKPEVAYTTAEGTWKQKIAVQSWLASYLRGLVGYTTWRRLDYPIFNIPETKSSYSDIPVRFTFPVNEQTLNEDNYAAAASAIGGDEVTTKIFWDKY